jgi:hypothetical protein
MRNCTFGLVVSAVWAIASGASAACLPQGAVAKAFTPRETPERSAGLLVMSGILMKMDPYEAKNLRRIRGICEVAELRSGRTVYAVRGTSDPALPRIITSNDRNAAVLFLMSVPDLASAPPTTTGPTAPLGYMLASNDGKNAYAFRAYDVIPADMQLASDVGAVLEGRVQPMLRADLRTDQVHITVANGAGEVVYPPSTSAQ